MKSFLLLVIAVLMFTSCTSPEVTKPKYDINDFDIWLGCKLTIDANGHKKIDSLCGGDLDLFELLFIGIDNVAKKIGYYKALMPPDNGATY